MQLQLIKKKHDMIKCQVSENMSKMQINTQKDDLLFLSRENSTTRLANTIQLIYFKIKGKLNR
jgi:hypothetical protein